MEFNENAVAQQVAKLDEKALAELAQAQAITISSNQEYEDAGNILKQVKSRQRELEAQQKDTTAPINEALKKVRELFRGPLDKLSQAEQIIKRGMGEWYRKEQQRIENERRAAAEAARKEQERLAKRAEKAAGKGDDEKAIALHMQAANVAPVAVQAEAPKASGVVVRYRYTAEVTDFPALVRAVAEGKASIELLSPNTSEIGKRARALKSEFHVPGITVRKVEDLAA